MHAEVSAALTAAAASESLLDRLLGTDCFSRAVAELEAGCRGLAPEAKARLALRLVQCQVATHGGRPAPCPAAAPLKPCLDALPGRDWQLYVEFLTHADAMCVYLQNQDFEAHAERLLTRLARGAGQAQGALDRLEARAEAIHGATRGLEAGAHAARASLDAVLEGQARAREAATAAGEEVGRRLAGLREQQAETLALQVGLWMGGGGRGHMALRGPTGGGVLGGLCPRDCPGHAGEELVSSSGPWLAPPLQRLGTLQTLIHPGQPTTCTH